ncbi:hypothetical protein AXG93_3042s1100 [Marchantia polymorpha subsp. ruderalis]|uniref:Uncharacterized protein n=1 Tax=Marchantia polymorpha subsp. ruderalis TaxID=1480154 RepID=A0A176VSR1_MARPO|nr:hypothetical protein AXG93_3042s1100 [Marchantia polymorpha subsp. ruderalis]
MNASAQQAVCWPPSFPALQRTFLHACQTLSSATSSNTLGNVRKWATILYTPGKLPALPRRPGARQARIATVDDNTPSASALPSGTAAVDLTGLPRAPFPHDTVPCPRCIEPPSTLRRVVRWHYPYRKRCATIQAPNHTILLTLALPALEWAPRGQGGGRRSSRGLELAQGLGLELDRPTMAGQGEARIRHRQADGPEPAAGQGQPNLAHPRPECVGQNPDSGRDVGAGPAGPNRGWLASVRSMAIGSVREPRSGGYVGGSQKHCLLGADHVPFRPQ